jgi:hypothetical protein
MSSSITLTEQSACQLALHTRKQSQIANELGTLVRTAGDDLLVQDLRAKYPNALHRTSVADRRYNCHGLTFAARRTVIWDPAEVQKILDEDVYDGILPPARIIVGDIAVYRSGLGIEHTGVVVDVAPNRILILSKWGKAHEVIHEPFYCPYPFNVVYYRIRS